MADWAIGGSGGFSALAGTLTGASSYGVQVTSSASTNVKGSWYEIVAAASGLPESRAFVLSAILDAAGSGSWDNLFDIGIGSAGSEKVICSNFGVVVGNSRNGCLLWVPITIPAATRVAVRFQSGIGSNKYDIGINLLPGTLKANSGYAGCTGEGADTSTSGGVSVTPGSNTKGSYAQIVAATARAYKGFSLRLHTKNTVMATQQYLIDVAIGAAGSEKIILPDIQLGGANNSGDIISAHFVPVQIPNGARLAVRAAGSGTTAFGASIVGFY